MEKEFVITEILAVIMVGEGEYPEKTTTFDSNLRCNELIFGLSGEMTVYFGTQVLETKEGCVRFLPKGDAKRYDVVRHIPGSCIDVFFNTDRPISKEAFVSATQRPDKIGSLFKKLFAVWSAKNEGYYFEAVSLLYKIFSELQKNTYSPNSHREIIKPAVDAIHDRFLSDDLSVSYLAELSGVCASYLQRIFAL